MRCDGDHTQRGRRRRRHRRSCAASSFTVTTLRLTIDDDHAQTQGHGGLGGVPRWRGRKRDGRPIPAMTLAEARREAAMRRLLDKSTINCRYPIALLDSALECVASADGIQRAGSGVSPKRRERARRRRSGNSRATEWDRGFTPIGGIATRTSPSSGVGAQLGVVCSYSRGGGLKWPRAAGAAGATKIGGGERISHVAVQKRRRRDEPARFGLELRRSAGSRWQVSPLTSVKISILLSPKPWLIFNSWSMRARRIEGNKLPWIYLQRHST